MYIYTYKVAYQVQLSVPTYPATLNYVLIFSLSHSAQSFSHTGLLDVPQTYQPAMCFSDDCPLRYSVL